VRGGGAIAAGSSQTAAAGAKVLEAGGNAVDAAVAACLACAAGEPTLTSLAGAGVMLHRDGASGALTLCDFFSNAPGLGATRGSESGGAAKAFRPESAEDSELDFYGVDLNFGPAIQRFHIGAASAAVPGAIPGLLSAHERWGRLPLAEVVAPGCELLREGVVLGAWQASAAALLTPILTATEAARRQFAPSGGVIGEGERYRLPQLADTLEALAREGWRRFYDGPLREALLEAGGERVGGLLTPADLDAFEVIYRDPLRFAFRDRQVVSNPPPAAGGELIGLLLGLLEHVPEQRRGDGRGEEWLRALGQAMRVCEEARAQQGKSESLLGEASLQRWRQRLEQLFDAPLGRPPQSPGGPPSTTHVSVVDGQGNAASVTFSYGEGNGRIVGSPALGDTGIMMNNLMGEEDLFPSGFFAWPVGERLATMMSPTMLVDDDGGVVVLGTGGANRIRTALPQVIVHLVDLGLDPKAATEAARLHVEAGVLNGETFDDERRAELLGRLGADELVLFDQPNLFFGGVHLVGRAADGTLDGAGDPRRAGCCVIVD
jgi:gamma-glutamyltranspeptidase/glutathione hydrolase